MAKSRSIQPARAVDTRVTEDGGAEEIFITPVVIPKIPQRFYFKFGKPVRETVAASFLPKISSASIPVKRS